MKQQFRALTLWQPWATCIIHGPKRVENRPWRIHVPPEGMWLAIHAGKRLDGPWEDVRARIGALWPEMPAKKKDYPRGAVLGIARLVGCYRLDDLPDEWDTGWASGPWCWCLDKVIALEEPIEASGKQGLWVPGGEMVEAGRRAWRQWQEEQVSGAWKFERVSFTGDVETTHYRGPDAAGDAWCRYESVWQDMLAAREEAREMGHPSHPVWNEVRVVSPDGEIVAQWPEGPGGRSEDLAGTTMSVPAPEAWTVRIEQKGEEYETLFFGSSGEREARNFRASALLMANFFRKKGLPSIDAVHVSSPEGETDSTWVRHPGGPGQEVRDLLGQLRAVLYDLDRAGVGEVAWDVCRETLRPVDGSVSIISYDTGEVMINGRPPEGERG